MIKTLIILKVLCNSSIYCFYSTLKWKTILASSVVLGGFVNLKFENLKNFGDIVELQF